MGASFHIWAAALCHAVRKGNQLVIHTQYWGFTPLNSSECGGYNPAESTTCFLEPTCPNCIDVEKKICPSNTDFSCISKNRFPIESAMEYLFRRLPDHFVDRLMKTALTIFPEGKAPSDTMITVHIRRSDKNRPVRSRGRKVIEMQLIPMQKYIDAVNLHIEEINHKRTKPANITVFIITEARDVLHEFQRAAPKEWAVKNIGGHFTGHGRSDPSAGYTALAGLVLGLEARYFVLSRESNWSRLLDELRTTRLDGICRNCTRMINLEGGA